MTLAPNAQQILFQLADLFTALSVPSPSNLHLHLSFFFNLFLTCECSFLPIGCRKIFPALNSHTCFNPPLAPQSQNLLPVFSHNPSMVHPSVPRHKSLIHLLSLCAQRLLVAVFFQTPSNSVHTCTHMRRLCPLNICSRASKWVTNLWVDDLYLQEGVGKWREKRDKGIGEDRIR